MTYFLSYVPNYTVDFVNICRVFLTDLFLYLRLPAPSRVETRKQRVLNVYRGPGLLIVV
jgi:hypothetical protein